MKKEMILNIVNVVDYSVIRRILDY